MFTNQKSPIILNHGIMGRFFALSIQHSQRNNSFCFSEQLEHFRLLYGPKNFLRRVPFLSFVTFNNFFPIHANTSFSMVRSIAVNLQSAPLMIVAYRSATYLFTDHFSSHVGLKQTSLIYIMPNQGMSRVRERNNF